MAAMASSRSACRQEGHHLPLSSSHGSSENRWPEPQRNGSGRHVASACRARQTPSWREAVARARERVARSCTEHGSSHDGIGGGGASPADGRPGPSLPLHAYDIERARFRVARDLSGSNTGRPPALRLEPDPPPPELREPLDSASSELRPRSIPSVTHLRQPLGRRGP